MKKKIRSKKFNRFKSKVKAFFRLTDHTRYTYHVIVDGSFYTAFASYGNAEKMVKKAFNRSERRKHSIEIYTIEVN